MRSIKVVGSTTLGVLLLVAQSAAESSPSPATAAAVFHLRSGCAALGEKILSANVVGTALYQSQISHYNPQTNRCYVELIVQTGNTAKPLSSLDRFLYDGQTGEMLADVKIENGEKSRMAYDQAHETATLANAGWDDANAYLNEMMADDRKR